MLVTQYDRDRLFELVRSAGSPPSLGNALAELARKLDSATILPSEVISPDVVTMNSVVTLMELPSGSTVTYNLVYPGNANVDELKISVLARLGVAMLGRTEGDIIEYDIPGGTKQFLVRKVVYQPETRLKVSGRNGRQAA